MISVFQADPITANVAFKDAIEEMAFKESYALRLAAGESGSCKALATAYFIVRLIYWRRKSHVTGRRKFTAVIVFFLGTVQESVCK